MNESWIAIPGYEGLYEVSDIGRVRSLDRYTHGFNPRYGNYKVKITGRILKLNSKNRPYPIVRLIKDKTPTWFTVHFLVLSAFSGERPSDDHQCNHKNGIKTDNRLCNLEWVTRSENMIHAQRNGLWNHRGEVHNKTTLTTDQVLEIRQLKRATNMTHRRIAKRFGVSTSCVTHIVARRTWKHV